MRMACPPAEMGERRVRGRVKPSTLAALMSKPFVPRPGLSRRGGNRSLAALSATLSLAALSLAGSIGCAASPAAPSASAATATSAPPAAAAPALPSAPALPFDPRVTRGSLENGLQYFLQRQKPADHRAHLTLIVKAGSMYEDDDQRGFAHLVEHMAFNGTKHFQKQTLIDFFEKSGITFGSDTNASTSYDRTRYELNVPTDDAQLLSRGLDILNDWASGVTFDPEEVEKERPVVLAERTQALGAGRRMFEQITRTLLAGSRYVDRDVIGDENVLRSGPRQRLVDFYQRWYSPDRMAVIVTGDIDPPAIEAALKQRFSGLARHPDPAPLPDLHVPIGAHPSVAVLTDPELSASSVSLVLKHPFHPDLTEADFRRDLLTQMAAGMVSRRLGELAEDPHAPFTAAGTQYTANQGGRMSVGIVYAQVKQGKLAESLDALLLEVERAKRHGFTEPELQRAIRDTKRAFEHNLAAKDTVSARAVAAELANPFVDGDVVTSPDFDAQLAARILADTRLEDVQRAAVEMFSAGEPVLIASGPARETLPDQASLLAALEAAPQKPVEPYRYHAPDAQLMAQLPQPGRVVKEELIAEIDTTVWTLSNGAVVVLKPTNFKDDEIVGQAIGFGGNAGVSVRDYSSARFADTVVARAGIGQFDRQSLAKVLSGKHASAYPWIREQDQGISYSAAPDDAETMFQLIHLYATAPRRDEAAFEAYRASLRENLRNRDLVPTQVFGDAVSKKVWGGSPRRMAPTVKDVDAIDLDSAMKFYVERFKDMSEFTFVFVGKIDPVRFKPLVERYLASLPGGGRKEKPRDIGLHRHKGVTEVAVQAGQEDQAVYALTFHGETPWSEEAHTDLHELGEYLGIRLREVLREDMGETYSPNVSSDFERVPFAAYTLNIAFSCKPKDVDGLRQALRRVIAETKKNGVTDSYVEKLKSERTRSLEQAYLSNGFWLQRLVDKFRMHEDPRKILVLTELTGRVTSQHLQAAARRFLRDDQYVEARLTPAAREPSNGTQTPASATAAPPAKAGAAVSAP
jgi:zinc protease